MFALYLMLDGLFCFMFDVKWTDKDDCYFYLMMKFEYYIEL